MDITAALLVVRDDTNTTHLIVTSPSIPGNRPTDRDVLCGANFASDTALPVVDVECGDCLLASLGYWGLPSWTETQLP